MAQMTFYPDPHVESTSVDGYVGAVVPEQTYWPPLRNHVGTAFNDDLEAFYCVFIDSLTTTNKWNSLYRGIVLFDTSDLPDAAVISAATLSLYGHAKFDNYDRKPNINVYSSAPASNIALEAGDFDSLGLTAFCDTPIAYDDWKVTDPFWNDFALNAAGIAAISLTGISKFGLRNVQYDVAESPPLWGSNLDAYILAKSAESGVGKKPKLVVTYSVGWEGKISGVTNPAEVMGVAKANIAEVMGVG